MNKTSSIDIEQAVAPGLFRRLAAITYDSLLLLAILVVATAVVTTGPEEEIAANNLLFQAYLLLVAAAFFVWFWTHGGQTLGMRAWRLRVVRNDGGTLTLWNGLLRFAAALLSWIPCGLGFLWMLVDPDKLTWHDRLSGTRLVVMAKPEARP